MTKWPSDNSVLHENQAEFMPGYSTHDDLFIVYVIINYKFYNISLLICFFVDFKAAFDKIDQK